MSGKNAKKARKEAKENESDQDKLKRLAEATEFKLMKPFGPSFGMFVMPDEMTKALLKKSDEILEDRNRVDWGKNLVGQIAEEPWISIDKKVPKNRPPKIAKVNSFFILFPPVRE